MLPNLCFLFDYLYVVIYFDSSFFIFLYICMKIEVIDIPTEAKLSTLVEFPPSYVPTRALRLLLQGYCDDACLTDGKCAAMILIFTSSVLLFPLFFMFSV